MKQQPIKPICGVTVHCDRPSPIRQGRMEQQERMGEHRTQLSSLPNLLAQLSFLEYTENRIDPSERILHHTHVHSTVLLEEICLSRCRHSMFSRNLLCKGALRPWFSLHEFKGSQTV
jgi:hypothetical protein